MNKFIKNKYLLLFITVFVILIGVGTSYSLLTKTLETENDYVINSGDLKIILDESKTLANVIQDNSIPMSDIDGRKLSGYNFSLVNNEITDMSYTIYIVDDTVSNKTPTNLIKLYYARDYDNVHELRYLSDTNNSNRKVLESGVIPKGETFNYNLKMWLSSTATNSVIGTSYSCHLELEATQIINDYYVDNSGAAYPELKGDLIPVKISDTGSVTKANIYEKWYDYNESIWANAVILNDNYGPFNDEDTIPEEAIEAYFVWIPRYEYKIFDEGNYTSVLTTKGNAAREIEIKFVTKDDEIKNGSTVGTWLTHPAFTSFNSNGMWVGKFESGYRGAMSTSGAQKNESDSSKLIIKPNVYSWRSIQVANAHLVSYNYKRDLDSHMMKNTEWGAVAYLSHSKYGNIGSIRMNNNSSYITGYSALIEPTLGYNKGTSIDGNRIESINPDSDGKYTINYLNSNSVVSSSTGNYSGIYDMSGGTLEYVMGVMVDTSGNPISGKHNAWNSGFKGTYGCPTCTSDSTSVDSTITENTTGIPFPEDNKYYDTYSSASTYSKFNTRILGDATGEMGPFYNEVDPDGSTRRKSYWYGNRSAFIFLYGSWFVRSGRWDYGSDNGVFVFANNTGGGSSDCSFRVVLTP